MHLSNRSRKALLLGLSVMTISYILVITAYSPSRKSELSPEQLAFDAAYDFATALRLNDQAAYEMADPALHSQIDEWIITHETQSCSRDNPVGFPGGGDIETGYDIYFDCVILGGIYLFRVEDIIVDAHENGFLIIDWGCVREEIQ